MIDITFLSMNFDVGGAQRHTIDLARSLRNDHGLSVRLIGLSVEQQLRLVHLDASAQGRGGLRETHTVGPVIGRMTAQITFNLVCMFAI